MRGITMRISILTLLFLFTPLLHAADSSGNYAIWGAGNKSCHKYNLTRAAGEDAVFKDYVMGYLTAYNHHEEETYSISREMNLSEIMGWLDEECELKPVIAFEEALVNFLIEHYQERMRFPPGGFGQ